MDQSLKDVFDLLVAQVKASSYTLPSAGGKIVYTDNLDAIKRQLSANKIGFEEIREGIEVYVDKFKGACFYSTTDTLFKQLTNEDLKNDFGVLFDNVYYDSTQLNFCKNNDLIPSPNKYENAVFYLKIQSLITANEEDYKWKKPLVSYHDATERTFILISGTKGTIKIGYTGYIPLFNNDINLEDIFTRLVEGFKAKGYSDLLKSEIYDSVKDVSEEGRYEHLLRNFKDILDNSDRNFEVYMNSFSFEDLRDKVKQEKAKYYNITKDILSKVYTQITGLTIAATATIFATTKVETVMVFVIVLVAYLVYAVFVIILLHVLFKETISVQADFDVDKPLILNSSKLGASMLQTEISSIENRISVTKKLIVGYAICFVLLSLLFVVFITAQLFKVGILNALPLLLIKIYLGINSPILN